MSNTLGIITDVGTAFICTAVLKINGRAYHVGTTPTGAPVVRSEDSGRDFRLQAEDLIELARRAGIDRERQE
jgi:hypothetical protein